MIMGFFDKLKRKKKIGNWEDAYIAAPNFYEKPDGTPFGAIALTEGTETVLPKSPQNRYRVDGKAVSEWKLVFVSTRKDAVIGDADYFAALNNMQEYILDSKEDTVLVKGLSFSELKRLIG